MSCCWSVDSDRWQVWEFQIQHADKVERRREWVDLKTGNRYLYDSLGTISLKCALIFVGIIPYLAIYAAFHAVRAICTPIATLFTSAHQLCKDPSWKAVGNLFYAPCKAFAKEIWAIVCAPFYALAMQFAALYGIFDPLRGGKLGEGNIQLAWHQKTVYEHVCIEDRPLELEALIQTDYPYTFQLAPCMLPHGRIDDPQINSYRRLGNEIFHPRIPAALPQDGTLPETPFSPRPQPSTA